MRVDGFPAVAKLMIEFYQQLIGEQQTKIVIRGCKPQTEEMIIQATKFSEGSLPLRYLGIPITASRLSKMECRSLVEKITARIKSWSIRNLSYTGRAALIHAVLMGKNSHITTRGYKANSIYKKTPYVAWQEVCLPKENEGIGLKNLEAWNKAWIAKLVWEVAKKKDSLWIKWVHGKYLINKD
ncbi:hypothetical protein Cgig2_011568 [Carnegiea gigantea]|uniref:Reverse transcriptase n=1 Tax=Carnegiea gigantea TaxID=171969 RepID=A0A9Q1GIG6_9CARY|nr:hypothetical protein Cgig2_011568 [Carnegiea gigantea]